MRKNYVFSLVIVLSLVIPFFKSFANESLNLIGEVATPESNSGPPVIEKGHSYPVSQKYAGKGEDTVWEWAELIAYMREVEDFNPGYGWPHISTALHNFAYPGDHGVNLWGISADLFQDGDMNRGWQNVKWPNGCNPPLFVWTKKQHKVYLSGCRPISVRDGCVQIMNKSLETISLDMIPARREGDFWVAQGDGAIRKDGGGIIEVKKGDIFHKSNYGLRVITHMTKKVKIAHTYAALRAGLNRSGLLRHYKVFANTHMGDAVECYGGSYAYSLQKSAAWVVGDKKWQTRSQQNLAKSWGGYSEGEAIGNDLGINLEFHLRKLDSEGKAAAISSGLRTLAPYGVLKKVYYESVPQNNFQVAYPGMVPAYTQHAMTPYPVFLGE